jgi:hypothetical protein
MINLFASLPAREEEIRVAFVALLEKENNSAHAGLGEGFYNYWGDLVAGVGALRDRRAIPALVRVIDSGDLATNGLAALANDSAEAVLSRSSDSNPLVRQAVTRTLSQMLDQALGGDLNAATFTRVKDGLIRAATDDSFWVRASAIPGLSRLPGREVTDALTNLAEHDPYWRPGEPGQPAQYYLVRERAKAALLSRQGR